MSAVVMARQFLTLKAIQLEVKDVARQAIDQVVPSKEILYESVLKAHENDMIPTSREHFLPK